MCGITRGIAKAPAGMVPCRVLERAGLQTVVFQSTDMFNVPPNHISLHQTCFNDANWFWVHSCLKYGSGSPRTPTTTCGPNTRTRVHTQWLGLDRHANASQAKWLDAMGRATQVRAMDSPLRLVSSHLNVHVNVSLRSNAPQITHRWHQMVTGPSG